MKHKQAKTPASGKRVVHELKATVLAEPALSTGAAPHVQPALSTREKSELRLCIHGAFPELQQNPPFIAFYNPKESDGRVHVLVLARDDPLADPGKDHVAIRVVASLLDKLNGKIGPYQYDNKIAARTCVLECRALDFQRALAAVLENRKLPPYPMDGIAAVAKSDHLFTAPGMRICIKEVRPLLPEPVAPAPPQPVAPAAQQPAA